MSWFDSFCHNDTVIDDSAMLMPVDVEGAAIHPYECIEGLSDSSCSDDSSTPVAVCDSADFGFSDSCGNLDSGSSAE